jgi:hypothetical protein
MKPTSEPFAQRDAKHLSCVFVLAVGQRPLFLCVSVSPSCRCRETAPAKRHKSAVEGLQRENKNEASRVLAELLQAARKAFSPEIQAETNESKSNFTSGLPAIAEDAGC